MNLPLTKGKVGPSLCRHFIKAAAFSVVFASSMAAGNAAPEDKTPVLQNEKPEATAPKPDIAAGFPKPARLQPYPSNMPYHYESQQPADEDKQQPTPAEVVPVIRNFTAAPEGWATMEGTIVSQLMRDIERRTLAVNPKFRVIILDDDSINLRRTNNDGSFRNRLYEVLNDRNVSLRWNVKSDIFAAMGGIKGAKGRMPQAMRITPDTYSESRNPLDAGVDQKNVCLVIPASGDVSSRGQVNEWIGEKTYATRAEAIIDPGPHAMLLRTAWHETWHCLDPYFQEEGYFIKGDSAINNAHRMHRAETYAEVAAILTMAATHPHMAQFMADLRAISSDYEARKSASNARPGEDHFYIGVIYDFTRALDIADEHIKAAGQEAVSKYSLDDIARHAYDITLRGAYSKAELQQRAQSLAAGAPVSPRVKQAKERMMRDTGQPLSPRLSRTEQLREEEVNQIDRFLRQMPAAEREDIKRVVTEYSAAAVAQGKMPEQGLVNLINDWRSKVQNEAPGYKAYEDKLHALSLLVGYGHLDVELRRRVRMTFEEIRPREDKANVKAEEKPPETKADGTDTPATKPPEPLKLEELPAKELSGPGPVMEINIMDRSLQGDKTVPAPMPLKGNAPQPF